MLSDSSVPLCVSNLRRVLWMILCHLLFTGTTSTTSHLDIKYLSIIYNSEVLIAIADGS